MRYLSVCSGIEAASVAWHSLNFRPVGFSEIEPFPSSVLSHRFPDVRNFGDMTRFEEWDINETVDILVGGTPCQSFSIAGLRGGLEDQRGNLALTYCRILQKFKPRWFVWENVPGVLSSNGGRDFGSILGAMVQLGYGIAYRILDAQYFGVPQRRRRVFVVGCAGDWRRAAEVLFEPGCVSGDSKKGRKKKSSVAALTANGVGTCGADGNQGQAGHLIPSITSHYGKGVDSDCTAPLVTPSAYQCHGSNVGPFSTLRAGNGNETGGVPFVESSTGQIAHCLNAGGMGRQDYETETMIACTLPASDGGVSSGYHPVVAFTQNQRDEVRELDVIGSLQAQPGMKQQAYLSQPIGVRRLTPSECERLQGFPDDWTLVPHRGKPAADGPRYKAIGNSMAVPVMRWIGKRIKEFSE